ncbi:mechanosensitive ion channel family protein [Microbulbifer yueqingensis]|uniref:Small-conductance mechanosensitive channel n=1 Tax=Microbulbifer yueqingensis TaxID=658219 RepID=A0A1G8Z8Z3_9GAMM|nr:mechanosensitive ion channel family protein [Microbulbifer yueqingensis]SDK11559.1 Small-conductance mechanosensitive channel [Microbulbifer yueqingensis]
MLSVLSQFLPAAPWRLPSLVQDQEGKGKEEPALGENLEEITPETVSEAAVTVADSLDKVWGDFLDHTPYLIASFMVLFVTWIIVLCVRHFGGRIFRRFASRKSLQDLMVRLLSIAIWLVGLLFAAMVLFPGLTPARALGAVGLLSVAIGLAFKDIFENFFAGILILWRFPFEEGDVIECEGVCGRVEAVEVRNTAIRRVTGELVVVPNLFLFQNPCEILTDRIKRRVTITASIAYGEDISSAVEVMEEAMTSCKTVRQDDPIQVFPAGFGESSIDIEVTWWTGSTPFAIRQSTGEVVTAIKKALDEAGIEIPFPYRTLTFKEPLRLREEVD